MTNRITINGETHTIRKWCEIKGIRYEVVKRRVNRGWSLRDAIMQPLNTKRTGEPVKERDTKCRAVRKKIMILGKIPEVFEHMQPIPGGIYDADYATTRDGKTFAVIQVDGKPLVVRQNEFVVVEVV